MEAEEIFFRERGKWGAEGFSYRSLTNKFKRIELTFDGLRYVADLDLYGIDVDLYETLWDLVANHWPAVKDEAREAGEPITPDLIERVIARAYLGMCAETGDVEYIVYGGLLGLKSDCRPGYALVAYPKNSR
jgi:hypothetical protein